MSHTKKNIFKPFTILVAVAENGVIGNDNKLIWKLSDDLKNFKKLTTGHVVIMGRKTFESIGRPLPNRLNIVISRNENLKIKGCEVVGSLANAFLVANQLAPEKEHFIIGGETIYRQTLPDAATIIYTKVYATPAGDAFFPKLTDNWIETMRESYEASEKNEFAFDIITYKNTNS